MNTKTQNSDCNKNKAKYKLPMKDIVEILRLVDSGVLCPPPTLMKAIEHANKQIAEIEAKQITETLKNPVVSMHILPIFPDGIIDELKKYSTVSPLGPLTSSMCQSTSKGTDAAKTTTNVFPGFSKEYLESYRPGCPAKFITTPDPKKTKCTILTIEVAPIENEMYYKIVKVENCISFDALPALYTSGEVAYYMTWRDKDIGDELCIRSLPRTKWIQINQTRISKSDLEWIINTMKKAGQAYINAKKEIAKVQKSAGEQYKVVI